MINHGGNNMRDPYSILGIPEGAPPEQVKAAYKELARKYGDEILAGSQSAQKKMAEIDAAYDSIIMNSSASYSGGYSYAGATDFGDIRSKIKAGRLDDAETLLDGMPETVRSAEWYYLKGTVQQKRGWLEEAAKDFGAACSMDPSNSTYAAAYDNINSARAGGYRTAHRSERSRRGSGCDCCDLCSGLLCADCCCECMGGDLIPCC